MLLLSPPTVILSAHGVSQTVRAEAEARGLNVFDATAHRSPRCNVVVSKMRDKGFEIVMIGHKGPPEVEGTLGQAEGGMYLVETPEDVARLQVSNPDKFTYVTQTTLSVDNATRVVDALRKRFPNITGPKKTTFAFATPRRTARTPSRRWHHSATW